MTDDDKALVEQATRRAAILHASASWGCDEDGALIDLLLNRIGENERQIAALKRRVEQLKSMFDTVSKKLEKAHTELRGTK